MTLEKSWEKLKKTGVTDRMLELENKMKDLELIGKNKIRNPISLLPLAFKKLTALLFILSGAMCICYGIITLFHMGVYYPLLGLGDLAINYLLYVIPGIILYSTGIFIGSKL